MSYSLQRGKVGRDIFKIRFISDSELGAESESFCKCTPEWTKAFWQQYSNIMVLSRTGSKSGQLFSSVFKGCKSSQFIQTELRSGSCCFSYTQKNVEKINHKKVHRYIAIFMLSCFSARLLKVLGQVPEIEVSYCKFVEVSFKLYDLCNEARHRIC